MAVTVKQSPPFGYGDCLTLGPYVRTTKAGMTYLDKNGRKRSVLHETLPKYLGAFAQFAHVEICERCPPGEAPEECPHGLITWCEVCADKTNNQ